jgi:hypothetical protein
LQYKLQTIGLVVKFTFMLFLFPKKENLGTQEAKELRDHIVAKAADHIVANAKPDPETCMDSRSIRALGVAMGERNQAQQRGSIDQDKDFLFLLTSLGRADMLDENGVELTRYMSEVAYKNDKTPI